MTELTASLSSVPEEVRPAPKSPTLWQDYGVMTGTLGVVVIPFIGMIVGIISLWYYGFGWLHLSLLVSMYVLTVLGITVGFHRLFTHRAFETHPIVQSIFVILGSMALQGPMLKWVAMHRMHHQHSDLDDDPHSPVNAGKGLLNWIRGAWHAHIGWFFEPDPPELYRYVKDLQRSKLLRTLSDLFPLWALVGLLVPAGIGALITRSWDGAFIGFIWGGLARVFLVHHVTWGINSICHLWGGREFETTDQSRNNFLFGILALGEGWHNNHHAFPVSAKHGLRWWQIDISYWVIKIMSWLGIAWKIRMPAA
ncbi:MAG TPA: acyl-CoA desaturase [Rickettsiales bacterium]|nr:acyl-CoA desaturase [Rickettsiales bacterium]